MGNVPLGVSAADLRALAEQLHAEYDVGEMANRTADEFDTPEAVAAVQAWSDRVNEAVHRLLDTCDDVDVLRAARRPPMDAAWPRAPGDHILAMAITKKEMGARPVEDWAEQAARGALIDPGMLNWPRFSTESLHLALAMIPMTASRMRRDESDPWGRRVDEQNAVRVLTQVLHTRN